MMGEAGSLGHGGVQLDSLGRVKLICYHEGDRLGHRPRPGHLRMGCLCGWQRGEPQRDKGQVHQQHQYLLVCLLHQAKRTHLWQ
nr:serine protease inhibitor Kazal-type 8 isoform X1 [Desmodus rotundus]